MLETFNESLNMILVPSLLAYIYISLLHQKAVKDSEVRNKLATWGIVISLLTSILEVFNSFSHLLLGNHLTAGTAMVLAILLALGSRKYFRDNNWFKKTYSKLKDGAKKLMASMKERLSSIGSAVPSPA